MNRRTLLRRVFITGFIITMLCFTMFFVFTNTMSVTAGSDPVIDSVSPISATQLQTITIRGSGFGDTQPVIMTLSDGSVNTVGGGKNMPGAGGTPVIQVNNYARNTWGSGVQDAPWTGGCAIGIFLEKWSDTEIVLGGFGSALSTTGQGLWNIKPGDPMRVVIITPKGIGTYDTTVVSNSTESSPTSSSMPNQPPPIISSVSPISPTRLQTICIRGSGFGIIPPQMIGLSDGSVNTVDGADTPAMQIRDNAFWGGWTAGRQGNAIGIIIDDWTDNQITLGGFGTALGTHGEIAWSIMSGDPIDIAIRTSGGMALFSTAVTGPPTRVNQTFYGSSPVITSISQITASLRQTIHIYGSGFGDVQPKTESLGDGSINTVGGGNTPIIQIHDDGWRSWQAGVRDSLQSAGCAIGIILEKWSDTEIILGGFGSALSLDEYGEWSLSAGDPMRVVIWTSGGIATCKTVVAVSDMAASSSAPEITSVTPITNQQKQTITIGGHGFGNIQPEFLDLGDGSVDTVWGKSTPCIVVYDKTNLLSAGAAGDWNGFTNGPPDLIGIFLVGWTDTQIVLGGFGSGLGSRFSWSQVSEGDVIQIQIQTAGGFATYELVASGDGSSASAPSDSSLAPSCISIIAEPLSTVVGSPVNVFGTLTDTNGDALQNKIIVLSYTFSGLDSWVPISSDLTDEQGKYAIQWVNSASGTFMLKAEWSGDETNEGTSNQTSLSFLFYQNRQTFIFESNSTIFDLDFNDAVSSLTFNVTGPSGTTGYMKVTIARSLVENAADIKVYLDGNLVNCEVTSDADAWVLTFTYGHSSHQISISLAANAATVTLLGIVFEIMIVATPIVAVVGVGLLVYFKKRKH